MALFTQDPCQWCKGRKTFGAGSAECICQIGSGEPRRPTLVRTPLRKPADADSPRLTGAYWRPSKRGDCVDVPRPCPYVGCRHNLYLDVNCGDIQFRWPHLAPWEVPAGSSCALDVADTGGATLDEVGAHLRLTRERSRQIEAYALAQVRRKGAVLFK